MAERNVRRGGRPIKDITGQAFGLWTALAFAGVRGNKRQAVWLCRCKCGAERIVCGVDLRNGGSTSCGCERDRLSSVRFTTHGEGYGTPEYRTWANAIYRCENPDCEHYASYGGRGITVCDRWRSSYEAFLA